MMIRSDGDIVRTVNTARDLTGLVVTFLKLWRKNANGVNDVSIPSEDFNVAFMPLKKENMLSVGLFYTRTDHWTTPTYLDPDDDMYVEGYGSGDSNISGYSSHSSDVRYDMYVEIPFKMLMSTTIEADIKQIAATDKAKKKEAARLTEIADLEAKLAELLSESTK